MATLEKIRSKSVLLFVIIIVALLAFILGDFLTSGKTYFGSGTTVAKNGDVKVEYEEYRRELESMQNQYQQAGQQVDNDELAQSVITSLLFKNMLKQHYEMLGLTVTDKEITNAMTGAMPAPAAQQFVYQVSQMLSLPQPDAQTVLDALNNPAKYNLTPDQANQLKAAWANIENNVNEELLFNKYNKLLNGLFVANDLDAKQTYDDISAQRNVAFISKAANTVPDADVKVTDEDIKAQWEKNKKRYALEGESRDSKQSYLMALAVKDVYDGDYKPYTASDINAELKQRAMAAKKVENLMNKYKGKGTTLEQYATAMEAQIDTMATAINSPLLLNLGAGEGSLQAKVATAAKGQLTGPVAGNNYVLVFKVLEDKNAERPFDLREFGARFRQTVGIDNLAGQKLYNILKGNNKTENNSLNFMQSLDDQQ